MTREDYPSSGRLPAGRYVPLIGIGMWVLLIPAIWSSPMMDAGTKYTGLTILSVFGICIPLAAMCVGLKVFLTIRRTTGLRDGFLSWCLAVNAALLLLFGFFLILIWPIVLKSP